MKTKKGITRILAFMLALLMVISTVEMTAFTSFAAERDEFETSEEVSEELTEDVSEEVSGEPSEEASEEVSEEVSEEASEEVSEEPSEELSEAYAEENIVAASEEDYGSFRGGTIYLDCKDMDLSEIPAYVQAAVKYWQANEVIEFVVFDDMPKLNGEDIIPKDIFNAVYFSVEKPEETRTRFDFVDKNGETEFYWYFTGLKEAKSDFTAKVVFEETSKNGLLKISLPNAAEVPAKSAYVRYEGSIVDTTYFDVIRKTLGTPTDDDDWKVHNFKTLTASLELIDTFRSASYYFYPEYESFAFDVEFYNEKKSGGWIWKEAYFAKSLDMGDIDDQNPITLIHPDKNAANVAFKVLDKSFAEVKDGKLSAKDGYFGVGIAVLCTYQNAEKEDCVEIWNYETVPGITEISFTKNEVKHTWDGNSSLEGILDFTVAPLERKGVIAKEDYQWEVENVTGNPIELVLKTGKYDSSDEYYDYYDGTYVVKGYGEAKVKVSYRGKEAVTTIKVQEPVKVPQIQTVYGVYGIDSTLADLDINKWIQGSEASSKGTFTWEEPSTKLDVASKKEVSYRALYTEPGRESVEVNVPVSLVLIEDFYISAVTDNGNGSYVKDSFPEQIKKGSDVIMGVHFRTYPDTADAFNLVNRYIAEDKIRLNWTDSVSKTAFTSPLPVYNGRQFKAVSKGTFTFKAAFINQLTKKTLLTATQKLQVYEKELFVFDFVDFTDTADATDEMKGTITLRLDEQNYANAGKKLTVKSFDTSVLQLGKMKVSNADASGIIAITIPYTFKKYGRSFVAVTANDECKTSQTFIMERIDCKPRLNASEIVIDKASYYDTVSISCYIPSSVNVNGSISMLNEKDSAKFNWNASRRQISIADPANCAPKTYSVVLSIPYMHEGNQYSVEETLKIKVIHTKNTIKAKQLAPVNTFYAYSQNDVLTSVALTSSKGSVTDAYLEEGSPFYLQETDVIGTFELRAKNDVQLEQLTAAQKKLVVSVDYLGENGYDYRDSVKLTLKTTKKAPKVTLNTNEQIFNTQIEYTEEWFRIAQADVLGSFDLSSALFVVDAKDKSVKPVQTVQFHDAVRDTNVYTIGKNQYHIAILMNSVVVSLASPAKAVASTDVIEFRFQMPHWSTAVTYKLKCKVQVATPQYELTEKTLILNMNEALASKQKAETYLILKGAKSGTIQEFGYLGVYPKDSKSKKVLANNLVIGKEGNTGIQASIVNTGNTKAGTRLKPGTYKYNLNVMAGGKGYSLTLNIKVVDVAPSKVFTYKQSGSIDVLNRETSYITLKDSFNPEYIDYGYATDFKLAGPDANLFEAELVDEEFRIYAKESCDYSTAKTYKVYPVVVWKPYKSEQTINVKGALQNIKVKQSKVSYAVVNVYPESAVLYSDSELLLGIAYLNKNNNEGVFPEKVELLNYNNDFYLDYQGDGFMILRLNSNEPSQIKKSNGTYTVKFAVTPEGAAINSKPVTVTYKVKIFR